MCGTLYALCNACVDVSASVSVCTRIGKITCSRPLGLRTKVHAETKPCNVGKHLQVNPLGRIQWRLIGLEQNQKEIRQEENKTGGDKVLGGLPIVPANFRSGAT